MRDDVKIGILLGFLLMVGMFVWWLVHSQAGKNAAVPLTGETTAHVDRSVSTPPGEAIRMSAPIPSPSPSPTPSVVALSPSPSPSPMLVVPIIPVTDPPALTEPPPVTPVPGPGTVVAPPHVATGGPVPGTTDDFNKLEVAPDGTRLYTTQADDVAWRLGVKFYGRGEKWTLIKDANPTVDLEHGLRAGVKIKIPVPPAPTAVAVTPHASATTAPNEYVVQSGDTLSSIAHDKLGNASLWRKILELNPGLDEKSLAVGKVIKLPPKADAHPEAVGPTHPGTPTAPATPALGPNDYQIQAGDTLSKIAREKLGKESLWDKIVELNPGLNPDSLTVGKIIKLPPKPAATAPAPAPAGMPDAPHSRL